jgi:hypothetical protein
VLLAARLLADSNLDEAAYRFPGEAGEAVDVAAALEPCVLHHDP